MTAARKSQGAGHLGPESELPDKLYFKIGEVAHLVGVQAHVLRYWEKEIPFIRPGKTVSNQRRYRRKDVELFREIRRLLHEERYTLAGARRRLASGSRSQPQTAERAVASSTVAQEPAAKQEAAAEPQLPLGFKKAPDNERVERVREGLRELIRIAGEEP